MKIQFAIDDDSGAIDTVSLTEAAFDFYRIGKVIFLEKILNLSKKCRISVGKTGAAKAQRDSVLYRFVH
jgi:hypothetical protein